MTMQTIDLPTTATLGAKLRRLRLAAGVSMADLADRSGISVGYVSMVETARCPRPSIPTHAILLAMEAALACTPGELTNVASVLRTPAEILDLIPPETLRQFLEVE